MLLCCDFHILTILDCWTFTILTANWSGESKRVTLWKFITQWTNHVKMYQIFTFQYDGHLAVIRGVSPGQISPKLPKPLSRYRDISIYQDGIWHHLGFSNSGYFNGRGPRCISMPNFVEIGQTVAEICWFLDFFAKMAAVHHIGFMV